MLSGSDIALIEQLAGDVQDTGVVVNTDATGVNKGDLLFFSADDTVSTYSNISLNEYGIGLASTTEAGSSTVKIANDQTVLTGVLSGATAGTKYFWDGSSIINVIPSGGGAYVWQVGYAKNTTDLYVDVLLIKKNSP
ncbi:MAG: hypothetical protein GY744_15885 [Gammaproteobacteria bacterium]|nr:hypothetical protein [Gammaproteobacteria bacterium]